MNGGLLASSGQVLDNSRNSWDSWNREEKRAKLLSENNAKSGRSKNHFARQSSRFLIALASIFRDFGSQTGAPERLFEKVFNRLCFVPRPRSGGVKVSCFLGSLFGRRIDKKRRKGGLKKQSKKRLFKKTQFFGNFQMFSRPGFDFPWFRVSKWVSGATF